MVFCEDLPVAPVVTPIPHAEGPPSQLRTATRELSVAWKLLWLETDSNPQAKDLYDAVLLAEHAGPCVPQVPGEADRSGTLDADPGGCQRCGADRHPRSGAGRIARNGRIPDPAGLPGNAGRSTIRQCGSPESRRRLTADGVTALLAWTVQPVRPILAMLAYLSIQDLHDRLPGHAGRVSPGATDQPQPLQRPRQRPRRRRRHGDRRLSC